MEELKSLADLLDLQRVDLEIARLIDRRGPLPELAEYRATHEELETLRRRLAELEDEAKTTARELDRVGGELELTEQKAATEENRLYAGGLSARDVEYLRREVEMLRGRISQMEDRVLELMEAKERLDAEAEELRGRIAELDEAKARLEETIGAEWRKIDAELAVKEERKSQIVPLVDEDLLALYEELRRRREGAVVGTLDHGVCGVCHLQLSAAEVAEVVRQNPPRCIHCTAILVP